VSMKFTPQSTALFSAPIASWSETWPQKPPMAQAPKLISEMFQPVRPNDRYFMMSLLKSTKDEKVYMFRLTFRSGPKDQRSFERTGHRVSPNFVVLRNIVKAAEQALGFRFEYREFIDRKSTRLNSSHANISY